MSERCPHGEQKVACSTCTIAALEAEVERITSELERVRNAEALATARHLTELARPAQDRRRQAVSETPTCGTRTMNFNQLVECELPMDHVGSHRHDGWRWLMEQPDEKHLAVAVEALREIAARPHAEWCPRYVSDLEACNCLANLEASAVATAALAKIEGEKP